jgi:hypothetical protein
LRVGDPQPDNVELMRLVRGLHRARQRFIEVTQALSPAALDTSLDESGWTARRLVEYCRAQERWHVTRMLNFFNAEVKIYDSVAASLDNEAPESTEPTLARELAEVWLAGRETEMWVDILEKEDVNAIRHASAAWPQGGWSIRQVFAKVTNLYQDKARVLQKIRKRPPK